MRRHVVHHLGHVAAERQRRGVEIGDRGTGPVRDHASSLPGADGEMRSAGDDRGLERLVRPQHLAGGSVVGDRARDVAAGEHDRVVADRHDSCPGQPARVSAAAPALGPVGGLQGDDVVVVGADVEVAVGVGDRRGRHLDPPLRVAGSGVVGDESEVLTHVDRVGVDGDGVHTLVVAELALPARPAGVGVEHVDAVAVAHDDRARAGTEEARGGDGRVLPPNLTGVEVDQRRRSARQQRAATEVGRCRLDPRGPVARGRPLLGQVISAQPEHPVAVGHDQELVGHEQIGPLCARQLDGR